MTKSKTSHTDVLVVGAGPVGLMMAGELARHGIRPRIIDKLPAPSDKSKAFGIHARTMEIFDNLGIVERFLNEGNPCNALTLYDEGKELAEIDFSHIESKYPFVLILAQSETERLLTEHLRWFRIQVERETELIGLEQLHGEVRAKVKLSDGSEECISSYYVVGCDGAHSTTRHILDLEFKGEPYPNYWLLADCDINWNYPRHRLSAFIHPEGTVAYIPFSDVRGRLIFELPRSRVEDEQREPTIEDVKRLAHERGLKYESLDNPVWVAYFKLHHRIVNRYSVGRAFLAGDAAHIHSPVGAQGMNLGIQDAYNLAWKIALVLRGSSPKNILDSYNHERRPIGEEVIGLTDRATRMVALHNPVLNAIRNTLVPIVTRVSSLQEKMTNTLAQVEFHYKGSPIVSENWHPSRIPGWDKVFSHLLEAGERITDYKLLSADKKAETNLYHVLKGVKHKLLLFTGKEPDAQELDELTKISVNIISNYLELVDVRLITVGNGTPFDSSHFPSIYIDKDFRMHKDFGAAKASLYLIRPDGYIAFRNQPAKNEDLIEYLSKIFLIRS
jgi:2-polyprenyl-6-methoxyphenol hydroxylase-like FAD-dependent oxidoreductase